MTDYYDKKKCKYYNTTIAIAIQAIVITLLTSKFSIKSLINCVVVSSLP